ncbi:MAG: sugar ABC transporter substrate-binding protein [Chloroflexia bacterium]
MRSRVWIVVLLLLVTACGGTTAPPPSPSSSPAVPSPAPATPRGDKTVLTVWHSWELSEEAIVRTLLEDYRSLDPEVTVRLRRVPVDRVLREYQEAVLAGEGPDLLIGRSSWIGYLADGHTIVSLENLLEDSFWDAYYPFAVEGVRYNGERYGVPFACETVALYYNKAFIPDPPTSTNRLLELAAMWPGEEQAGLAFPLSFYNTIGYLHAFGGQLFDEQGNSLLGSPETKAWLFWLYQVRTSPGVVATDSYSEADARFKAGRVAMTVNGSWALSDYVQALGESRLGVARLPMLSSTRLWPAPFVGCQILLVNPAVLPNHPKATLDLLRFLGGPLFQRLLVVRSRTIPTWREIDLSGDPLLSAFLEQALSGRPRPTSRRLEVYWDATEGLIYNVTTRRVPVDVALEETLRQIEKALAALEGTAP